MYQRPSNKSSDRHHHPHHRHHHHLQLHTHRKLLYLEGLDKFWFCSLLRYTLNHCIQLDFFFICVFLKRYRQNTVKNRLFWRKIIVTPMVTSPNYRSLKKWFFLIWSGIPPSVSNNSIFFTCAIFWRDMAKILWKMGDFSYILICRI